MQRRRSTLFGSVLAGALSVGLLTGCGTSSDYPVALATQLQTSVQLVTQLASDGEYQAALTALRNLREDLAAAQKDGTVDAERVAEIEAAIAVVAKDLKTKIGDEMVPDKKKTSSHEETSQAPAPAPEVPVNPVPAPEAPAPAPAPAPVPSETGSPTPTPPPTTTTPTTPPPVESSPPPSPPPEETVPAPEPPPSSTAPAPAPTGSTGLPGIGPESPPQEPPSGEAPDGGNSRSGAATP
ncbi:hypothetical protein [Arthrobacter pigmenti]